MFTVRNTFLIAGLALLTTIASTDSLGEDIPLTVSLEIEAVGKFEIIHSRAESTATGAVLFGLIGAGISESNRAGKDKRRKEAIAPFLDNMACAPMLIEATEERLDEKGFKLRTVDAGDPNEPDVAYVIVLKIGTCGFKMMDSQTDEVAAFVVAEYHILKPGQKKPKKRSRMLITGKHRQSWEALVASPEVANAEFAAIKIKAGRRLANKVIYDNP